MKVSDPRLQFVRLHLLDEGRRIIRLKHYRGLMKIQT
jgi:hypothetical protein